MPVQAVAWADVVARRLARSALVGRSDDLVEVTGRVCGVHAQVQASAELQLAARVPAIVQADVRDALWERRELVRAWTLRGTLHLHPAAELAFWHAARRAVAHRGAGLPEWRDPAGVVHAALAPEEVAVVLATVRDVLDGRCLLREQLVDEVVARVGSSPRERLRSGFAFFLGDLCHGPPQGTKVTFARPDQWIADWQDVDETEALRTACRRFLRTYGPARPGDFLEWFGAGTLKAADARELFETLELDEVDVEGRRAFVLSGDTSFPASVRSVRLLSEYDAYVMGFRERDVLVPEPVREQVAAHGRGRYEGPAGVRLLLVDGVAAGIWERAKRGPRIELRVRPARRLDAWERGELQAEAARVGAFLGLEPVLTID